MRDIGYKCLKINEILRGWFGNVGEVCNLADVRIDENRNYLN
jgi:hypothetical protein